MNAVANALHATGNRNVEGGEKTPSQMKKRYLSMTHSVDEPVEMMEDQNQFGEASNSHP